MTTTILDATQMRTRSDAHAYLKEQLNFPDYYGNNLDALHDCLTEMGPIEVTFINFDDGGDFFLKVYRVFKDSAKENDKLRLLEGTCCVPEKN